MDFAVVVVETKVVVVAMNDKALGLPKKLQRLSTCYHSFDLEIGVWLLPFWSHSKQINRRTCFDFMLLLFLIGPSVSGNGRFKSKTENPKTVILK